jgi:hypothetical protein
MGILIKFGFDHAFFKVGFEVFFKATHGWEHLRGEEGGYYHFVRFNELN